MILESSPTTSHRFVILHKSRNPSSQSSMWNILNFSSTHSLLMLHQERSKVLFRFTDLMEKHIDNARDSEHMKAI
ncbi:hypothetical protein P3L10_029891 [Capsicum annuum]